jgi:hypothetical protein
MTSPFPTVLPRVFEPVNLSKPSTVFRADALQPDSRVLPIYRFDGGRALRSFTHDLGIAAGLTGASDGERKLAKASCEVAVSAMAASPAQLFTNIAASDVNEIQPPTQRADLYVGQQQLGRPLGSLVTRSALSGGQPQMLPTFAAAANLVDASPPITDPSTGTVSTTGQTLTPVSFAARVNINRDVIDSGGSPQADMLVGAAIATAIDEVLEARLATLLDGLSLSASDVTGVGSDVVAAVRALITATRTARGGQAMSSLALNPDLYGALADAVSDNDGVPLLAVDEASGDVHGVGRPGRPCWALGDHSYLLDPRAVCQLTYVQNLRFEQVNVSSIAIGLFGFSLEAELQTGRVTRIDWATS